MGVRELFGRALPAPNYHKQLSSRTLGYRLLLPGTLDAGQRHAFSRIIRVPAGQRISPHYVHVPQNQPKAAWAVTADPRNSLRPDVPGPDVRTPDDIGEIHV